MRLRASIWIPSLDLGDYTDQKLAPRGALRLLCYLLISEFETDYRLQNGPSKEFERVQ
jgi:hypothetical protein